MAADDRSKPAHINTCVDARYTPISSPECQASYEEISGAASLQNDAPLDFSVKRREQKDDGGDRATRMASLSAPEETTGCGRDRDAGDTSDDQHLQQQQQQQRGGNAPVVVKQEAPSPSSRANGLSPKTNGYKRSAPAHVSDGYLPKVGEPQLALPPGILPSGLMPTGAAAAAAAAGMFPVFPAAFLNGLPGIQPDAAKICGEPRQNGKSPFKAYGGGSLKLSRGSPGPSPLAAAGLPLVDLVAAQAMAASSEEMFAQYRSYIMALQDQLKLQQTSPGGSSTTSSTASQGVASTGGDLYSPKQQHQETANLSCQQSPTTTTTNSSTNNACTTSSTLTSRPGYSRLPTRRRGRTLPEEQKDELYWERRRKNNEAAKRSRDARRAKEDEIAIRAAFLEQENLKLRVEVAALKNETAKLRCMLYNS